MIIDEIFKYSIIALAVISFFLFIFTIVMIKKMIDERKLQNYWMSEIKDEYKKEIEESKRKMLEAIKFYYKKINEVAEGEFKDLNELLKFNTNKIKDKFDEFETEIKKLEEKLEETKPKLEELKVIEEENRELRKDNRRLQNALNRISKKAKNG